MIINIIRQEPCESKCCILCFTRVSITLYITLYPPSPPTPTPNTLKPFFNSESGCEDRLPVLNSDWDGPQYRHGKLSVGPWSVWPLWDRGGLALYHNCTTISQTEQDSPQYLTHAPKYNICPLYLRICMQTLWHFSYDSIRMHLWIKYVTRSHEMSLNLKFGNLRYLFWYLNHVSTPKNVDVTCLWRLRVWRRPFEKISFKVGTVHWIVFP